MENKDCRRLSFPADELKYPWLSMLLGAYAVIDEGVDLAAKKRGRGSVLACREGCDNCCRNQPDIPVYPIEVAGLYWHSTEKAEPGLREALKERLSGRIRGSGPCPFLISGSCAAHPVRPVSCRQLSVIGGQCSEGEDPFFTRRDDVVSASRECLRRAFSLTLPFYGLKSDAPDSTLVIEGIINTQAGNILSHDWRRLAALMQDFDSGRF